VESFNIIPHILQPKDATAGVATRVMVDVLRRDGSRVAPADLPPDLQLEASADATTVPLVRDSQGLWAAEITFMSRGSIPLHARAFSKVYLDRTTTQMVEVRGEYEPGGGPYLVDFKTVKAGSPAFCVPVSITRKQEGPVSMSVEPPASFPAGVILELQPPTVEEGRDANLCLTASADAPSSREARGAAARLVAKAYPGKQVPLVVRWDVQGLTWWERWRHLILILVGVIALVAIALGWILPHRWPRGMAIACAPSLAELDLQKPVPITTFSGVGIGFYRDARAYVHSNFRISGKREGAVVEVRAAKRGVLLESLGGALFRTDGGRGWNEIKGPPRRGAMGEPYRIGEKGPYFRLQMGRRT
jgi:hypothetical protein